MSTESNKRLVARYYEEIVNTGNVEAIEQFISSDYEEVHENKRYPRGIEGAIEHVRGVRATYPDLTLTIEQQIAEGPWVVSRVTMVGTHEGGEWLGIQPTGAILTISGVNIDKVVDGRIVEHGGAAYLLGPLLEAGAVQPTPRDDA